MGWSPGGRGRTGYRSHADITGFGGSSRHNTEEHVRRLTHFALVTVYVVIVGIVLSMSGAGQVIAAQIQHVIVENFPATRTVGGTVGIDPAANAIVNDMTQTKIQPYTAHYSFTLPSSTFSDLRSQALPPGQMFVVESISGEVALPMFERFRGLELFDSPGVHALFVPPTLVGNDGSFDHYGFNIATRGYFTSSLTLSFARSDLAGSATVDLYAHGYLIPIP